MFCELTYRGFVVYLSVGVGHPMISYSLKFCKLWLFVMVSTWFKEKLLWWEVRNTLEWIFKKKFKNLLTLKIIVTSTFAGIFFFFFKKKSPRIFLVTGKLNSFHPGCRCKFQFLIFYPLEGGIQILLFLNHRKNKLTEIWKTAVTSQFIFMSMHRHFVRVMVTELCFAFFFFFLPNGTWIISFVIAQQNHRF